jgi:hypothetical protein
MTKNIKRVCILLLTLLLTLFQLIIPFGEVAAADANQLSIDVWTNKGGQGAGASGGTYNPGEDVTLYVKANISSQGQYTISGPTPSSGNIDFDPGQTYSVNFKNLTAGQYSITFNASAGGQKASDTVSWTVIGASPTPASPTSSTQSQSNNQNPSGGTSLGKAIDSSNASELGALIALRITRGLLTNDLEYDIDGDGKVTAKDVRIILKMAIKAYQGDSILSSSGSSSSSPKPPLSPSGSQPSKPTTPAPTTASTSQALVGKWEMARSGISPALPNQVPQAIVDQVVRKTCIFEIARNKSGQLTILYKNSGIDINIFDDANTWYQEVPFMGNWEAGKATASESQNGKSCSFKSVDSFSLDSLPGVDVRNIKASATSTVLITLSGDSLDATITIDGIKGSFENKSQDGQWQNQSINYVATKITYHGVKK